MKIAKLTMKKYIIIALISILSFGAAAQGTIGLKFSPVLSTNRVQTELDDIDARNNGVGMRFIFGPTVDIFLAENYYISTGLFYTNKRLGFEIDSIGVPSSEWEGYSEVYDLQYVQIPLSIKMLTNEIALDTKLYFQIGAQAEILIDQERKDKNYDYVDQFKFYDFSIQFAVGLEYSIGMNTILFGGIVYNRGLVPVLKDYNIAVTNNYMVEMKNNLIGLDIGIKF